MRHCLFLLAAGFADAALTQLGIVSGFVDEGNPLMRLAIEKSWTFFYVIKIILPLILITISCIQPLTGMLRRLMISASFLYGTVLCLHLSWLISFLKV